MSLLDTVIGWAGGGQGIMGTALSAVGSLFDLDRNTSAAADQRQAAERGAERQMDFQRQEASTARDFAERVSGQAHQRQTADMRAAGLNPILSATGGHGASSPTVGAPSGAQPGSALQTGSTAGRDLINSAQASQRLTADLNQIKVNTQKLDAERRLAESTDRRTYQDELLRREEIDTERITQETMKEQLKGIRLEGDIDETKWGEILRYINRANPLSNSAGRVRDMFRQRGN